MREDLDKNNEVSKYLLGTLDDPVMMSQMEELLMVDDQFPDELTIVEDQLIEKYLDDELTPEERGHFVSHFLAAPSRKRQLRFARDLRKIAASAVVEAAAETIAGTAADARAGIPDLPADKARAFDWRRCFSLPAVRFAAALVVVAIIGFGVWRVGFYRSDVDRGLAELKLAYKSDRQIVARIVDFDYAAPPPETRGGREKDNKPPSIERENAARILEEALAESRTVQSLYGMGKVSLAKKDLEKAIAYFEEAAARDPANAAIESDLGAAYVESGKNTLKNNSTKGLELLDKGRKHLERSIKLDPKLLEPRFNRALCLELVDPEQAKTAWLEYTQLDPASRWTEEARMHLNDLTEKSVTR